MLKLLSKSCFSLKLLNKSIAGFAQPFTYKESDFMSDGESDSEQKATIGKYQMFTHFQNAQTIEDVIKAYKENNLNFSSIHLAAFQLAQIIKPSTEDKLLEEFIQENIIVNLDELNPEQIITILQLLLKVKNKFFSASLKKYIDQNLMKFKYLHLPYVFAFYSKSGWKLFHIGKILKQQLPHSQFTAHSLCQIIRGCYIEYLQTRSTYHSDLAFMACKQLSLVTENLNFHGSVALFNQLVKLRLHQTTSFKKFPPILFQLQEIFLQNYQKVSLYSKIKLLEAFQDLPDSFPKDLYKKLGESLQSDSLNSQNLLRLYLVYQNQPPSNRLPAEQLQSILNKIIWNDINNDGLLLNFVETDVSQSNQENVNFCIRTLKVSKFLSPKQKVQFIRALIKQNRLEDIFELISNDPESLPRLIDQVYYSHKWIKKASQEEMRQNIRSSVEKLMEKLENMDEKSQLSICHYILTLDPYENDPFYDFINRKINLESLQGRDFEHFLLRLNSKNHFNDELRKKADLLSPTIEQLQHIINNLGNTDYLNEKLVRSISKWLFDKADKSLIDESFDLTLYLNLLMKLVINCPIYSLHNMRGTIALPIRELFKLLSKQSHQQKEPIKIDINQFIRFHQTVNQMNIKTSLLNNIAVNLSFSTTTFDEYGKFSLALLVTELNIQQFHSLESIKQLFNDILASDSATFFAILTKTKVLLYQMKHQGKLNKIPDDVHLGIMIDQLKQAIIVFDKSKHNRDHYLEALMTLLDYDGWRISNVSPEDDGLQDFIQLYFQNIDDYMNMRNMRPGLKVVIKTLSSYDTKFQFVKKYEKLFLTMFKKCKLVRYQERPHIQVCLDYIEFAKRLKINDKETFDYLVNSILDQIDNLRQVQIVDVIQKLSEQKLMLRELYDKLSELIIKKMLFYNTFELMDTLTAFAKVGYFNENLFRIIVNEVSPRFENQKNSVGSVQYLWTLLVCQYYFAKSSKLDKGDRYQKMLTTLMQDVLKFTSFKFSYPMPIVFRQFMDIYNLLEYSLHLDLQLNQQQSQLSQKIVENGKNLMTNTIIPNQKLNLQNKSLLQFLENNQLEYKINYFFDNQYVDCYVQLRNQVIQVDNSIYVTQDMEQYTGFHYFNKWILEGVARKYGVTVIRIQAWQWTQLDDSQKKKILQM